MSRVLVSGVPPKNSDSKGTAVKKSSQIQPVGTTAVPERVSVAMTEIAENMQEGLLALAVGAGLQVMAGVDGGRRDRVGRAEGQAQHGRGPRCGTAVSAGR